MCFQIFWLSFRQVQRANDIKHIDNLNIPVSLGTHIIRSVLETHNPGGDPAASFKRQRFDFQNDQKFCKLK